MANTAIQKTEPAATGANQLKAFFDRAEVRNKLTEVASDHFTADELTRLALLAASRQPDLLKCTQTSVLRALIDAAELGIKPGGVMGRGYLVPRWNNKIKPAGLECCFDPGWRGLADIARRSGKVRRIEAHVVHEADEFEVTRSPMTTVRHEPSEADDPGPIRAAFAVAEFDNGAFQIEVVFRRDLDKIRAVSAAKAGPWQAWPDEMARKSAVRRLCKYLPFDPMLERAMNLATEAEIDERPSVVSVVPQTTRLAKKISSKNVASAVPDVSLADPPADIDPDTGEVIPTEAELAATREPGQEG